MSTYTIKTPTFTFLSTDDPSLLLAYDPDASVGDRLSPEPVGSRHTDSSSGMRYLSLQSGSTILIAARQEERYQTPADWARDYDMVTDITDDHIMDISSSTSYLPELNRVFQRWARIIPATDVLTVEWSRDPSDDDMPQATVLSAGGNIAVPISRITSDDQLLDGTSMLELHHHQHDNIAMTGCHELLARVRRDICREFAR